MKALDERSVPVPRARQPGPIGPPLWERRVGPFRFLLYPPTHPTADVEIAATLVGGAALAGFALLPLGELAALLPECRFHAWTGRPCATCGITRGLVTLGDGAWREALRLNPLLVVGVLAFLAYAVVAAGLWAFRLPRPRLGLASRGARVVAILAVLAAILANWAFLVADGR